MKSEIRHFIVENYLFGRDNGFGEEESFLDRGILDSTGVMELIAFIEGRFGVKVEDHELLPENLDTLSSLARFIEQKVFLAKPYAA
ncbi:MAG TPA: acyl carrier protein [Burkholderiales bacterium]|jgi:acyl carrier protein|nr:acyl carrier protein [Burkholderiales bacterium]